MTSELGVVSWELWIVGDGAGFVRLNAKGMIIKCIGPVRILQQLRDFKSDTLSNFLKSMHQSNNPKQP